MEDKYKKDGKRSKRIRETEEDQQISISSDIDSTLTGNWCLCTVKKNPESQSFWKF